MNPLKRLRLDAGLTQVELADLAGVDKGIVFWVERGNGSHPSNLKALADTLSECLGEPVRASDLLSESDPKAAA